MLGMPCSFSAGSSTASLSKLEPSVCEDVKTKSELLEASYHRAWQLLQDNTMYPERLSSWQQWEHRFDGKLHSSKEFEEAVKLMIADIKDQYTYFRNASDTQTCKIHDEDNSVVSAYKLAGNTACISIHSFSSLHTASELEAALQQFDKADGYILDLRGNHGGYVEQALASFELLTDEGRFVSMEGREEGKAYREILDLKRTCLKREINGNTYIEARRKNLCGTKPMLVLVDEDTRSAAEMLAGALKDTHRARLVGMRTFGKGVVQSSWNLEPDCSIKIAMAHYYLPSGNDINGSGIAPDYYVNFKEQQHRESNYNGLANALHTHLEKLLPELILNSL